MHMSNTNVTLFQIHMPDGLPFTAFELAGA